VAAESTTQCIAPSNITKFDFRLGRTAHQLADRKSLRIVALGSSSTAGAGASSAANTYPNRLSIELSLILPSQPLMVLNRGINGEQAIDMLARFDESVAAEHPDLVLWQLGTNAVLRGDRLSASSSLVRHGIERIKSIGADVVLIDPQFAP